MISSRTRSMVLTIWHTSQSPCGPSANRSPWEETAETTVGRGLGLGFPPPRSAYSDRWWHWTCLLSFLSLLLIIVWAHHGNGAKLAWGTVILTGFPIWVWRGARGSIFISGILSRYLALDNSTSPDLSSPPPAAPSSAVPSATKYHRLVY